MGVFEKALRRGDEILRYIPQRPPVVVVDTFYGVEGELSVTGYTTPNEGFFCTGGVMDECALVENMAQSAALRVGWLCAQQEVAVPLGFIASVDRCTLVRRAVAGEELRTTVRIVAEAGGVTLAEAWVECGGERICEGRLKIFLQR